MIISCELCVEYLIRIYKMFMNYCDFGTGGRSRAYICRDDDYLLS